ncbi:MAG: type II toxin-antitoxin system HicB family antitoxin [Methanoculleus sp.]|nr:type II toxin-antitoxin system HicB family antitoxin [Methanoculleus sp.]
MILEYINAALEHARYEIIEDDEPYYGEVPELPGVWATGKTLEECRRNLAGVIDEWLIVRLRRGLPIPRLAGHTVGEDQTGLLGPPCKESSGTVIQEAHTRG